MWALALRSLSEIKDIDLNVIDFENLIEVIHEHRLDFRILKKIGEFDPGSD